MSKPKVRDQENLKVRLLPAEAEAVKRLAEQNERSVAAEIRLAVRAWLAHERKATA